MKSDTLSIIVVALNEAANIERLFQSLTSLTLPPGVTLETLLVDGGSTDGTAEEAKRCGFTKILVEPGANIPSCRNRGAVEATGAYIAYIDADCELDHSWLRESWNLVCREQPAICGWPVQPPTGDRWVSRAWYIHWSNKNPVLEKHQGVDVIRHEAFRLITTRNMLLNRQAFDRVNGFDEALATGEDTDFVFRAYHASVDVFAIPSMKALHYGEPQTLRDFFKQQLWHANRSSYRKIQRISGNQVGGNAPKFTALFTGFAALALCGLAGLLATAAPVWAILFLPLLSLISLPAVIITGRGKQLRWFPALCLLYSTYGLARSIDLLGLHRVKSSWKSG